MAKSIAEIREFNRLRRARQRAAQRAAGVPSGAKVTAAIGEAVSFAMRAGVNIGDGGRPQLLIDSGLVITTAVDILVRRHRCNRRRSSAAVASIVSPRPEHTWPSYVPTHAGSSPGAMAG